MKVVSPILTGLSTSVSFLENLVNEGPLFLDTSITLSDVDNDFNGGELTLVGVLAEDTVSVNHVGTGLRELGVSGANISFSGVVIGTISGGNGTDLTITFNSSATSESVSAVLKNLVYSNASGDPTTSRDFVINVADSLGNDSGVVSLGFTAKIGAENPFQTIGAYSVSNPTFVDLSGNGYLDLVVGEWGGGIHLYTNVGGNYTYAGGFDTPGGRGTISVDQFAAPAFVDLDSDGDYDMVAGSGVSGLRSFENTALGWVEMLGAANPFDSLTVANNSTPTFVNLDEGADLDLVIGTNDGFIRVFTNIGSGYVELTGASNPFASVSLPLRRTP